MRYLWAARHRTKVRYPADASKGSPDIDAPDRTHPVTGAADPLPTHSRTRQRRRRRQQGQSLVEFAIVFPFFMVLLFGVVEFGFALNGALSVDFASRDAALAAAEAGTAPDADCSILKVVQNGVTAPADASKISEVRIYLSDQNGKPKGGLVQVYVPGGSVCPGLPYRLSSGNYPSSNRCNVLAGCGTGSSKTTTVDTIGVQITYRYDWKTPLPRLLPLSGTGFTIVMDNAMRMEPVL